MEGILERSMNSLFDYVNQAEIDSILDQLKVCFLSLSPGDDFIRTHLWIL